MAETICIYDQHGNKICYGNHHPAVAADIEYAIAYFPKDPHEVPQLVTTGNLPRSATCLDKLRELVDRVDSDPNYKVQFANFKQVEHAHKDHAWFPVPWTPPAR